ncbi:hypothetical protein K435DRAFT_842365 [Dendrothele bispora CBS 962.96]|uniref:Uncharacterized protein n=1 Tax=Dendrothele bispora (strain CBS 962.96) TaxID=1314807 RepID=A0A4S8LFX7_DENBC|nr:hypothetical protein K435DRAFT_842365 [Dendrothele bispora CBS 962.96]
MDTFLVEAKSLRLERPEDAATLLCSLMKATRKYLNPNSKYATSTWYLNLLEENAELYALTKEAHERLEFGKLTGHPLLQSPPHAWNTISELSAVDLTLEKIRREGRLRKAARGEEHYKIWQAQNLDENTSIVEHLQALEIPTTDEESWYPSIILYKLGSFRDDDILKSHIDSIFYSEHTFLLNSSGTGKTRLLFEGLCNHWGLFFTCVEDFNQLGSSDTFKVINNFLSESPDFRSFMESEDDLRCNRRVAYRYFSEVLLSRLLLFKLFLEYTLEEGIDEGHKKRWLLAQLSPGILWGPEGNRYHDYFLDILTSLNKSGVTDEVIDDAIMQTMKEILGLWDFTETPFYIVLDEANYAASTYTYSFRDDVGSYPILKEIIRTWRRQLGHFPISFVVSGTEIPREYFFSAEGEWDDFRWCSDTGCFDDPEVQRRYVTDFLPEEMSASPEGRDLLQRIWRWLRGRHRFTAGFITILLQTDFSNPHIALNSLVHAATYFQPNEGLQYPIRESPEFNNYYQLDMKGMEASDDVALKMHESILFNLCHYEGLQGGESICDELVAKNYGHFLDDSAARVAVDEPLILVAGTDWFTNTDTFLLDVGYFNKLVASSTHKCKKSHKVNFIALCLALAFDEACALSDVFTFPNSSLNWTKQTAELVLRKSARSFQTFQFSTKFQKLMTIADSLPQLTEWLKSHRTPFCIYRPDEIATLIFALKLKNKTHIWVTLHYVDEDGYGSDALDLDSLNKKLFELDNLFPSEDGNDVTSVLQEGFKRLPKRCQDVGTLGLLRTSGCLKMDADSPEGNHTDVLPFSSIAHLSRDKVANIIKERHKIQDTLIQHAVTATKPKLHIAANRRANVMKRKYRSSLSNPEHLVPDPERRVTRSYARENRIEING